MIKPQSVGVTKDNNGVWNLDPLSDMEKKKIQGMY